MHKYFSIPFFMFCFLIIGSTVQAQKKTTVYAEFLGNGYAWGTLNLDYRIGENDQGFGVRVGYSFGESANVLGMINYLIGSSKSKIEVGAGLLNFSDRDKLQLISSDIAAGIKPTFNISYRYHGDKGLVFKVGWTPFIIDNPEVLYTWVGVGIGWKI